MSERTPPRGETLGEYDRDALRFDLTALDSTMPLLLAGGVTTTVSVHMLDRMYRALRATPDAARSAPSLDESCVGDPSHQFHSHDDDPPDPADTVTMTNDEMKRLLAATRQEGIDYARTRALDAARSAPSLDVEELTALIDRHWMDWNEVAKSAVCSCGGWQFDGERDIVPGEHFAPFSRHVAQAIAAEYARIKEQP